MKEGRSVGRVERPSGNLNSSDDLFGKTWAGPTVRGAWLDEEEARCGMGREREGGREGGEPKRTNERDGRGRRQALIKNGAARRRMDGGTADIIPPAERERWPYIRIGRAE